MEAVPDLPLVPLIRADPSARDPVVLATWHAALSNAVGVELPHTLLALWLYPAGGGAALLAPEELAQDHLTAPLPGPELSDSQLNEFVQPVRRAYPSVLCVPIRFGRRVVGLLLLAELTAERYGDAERALAEAIAAALAPTFARLARRWAPAGAERSLLAAITDAWGGARSPADFFRLVSEALEPQLPHDLLEALIPAPGGGEQYRLARHAGPPPWADPALVLPRERIDLAQLFGGESVLRLADAADRAGWSSTVFAEEMPHGQPVRSLIAVRVTAGGHLAAHLLVGSGIADLYQEEDAALVEEIGRLIAPQVEAYVLASQLHVSRKQVGVLRTAPAHRARIADMLATTPKFADATRRLADEVRALVPCDKLTIAVRMLAADRVVLLEPGETRHLADLPLTPVSDTPLGQVLRLELADAVRESARQTELIIPLRAVGQTVGALVVTARGFGAIGRDDVVELQHLADIVAPYIELARRQALTPAPVLPGWKRTAS